MLSPNLAVLVFIGNLLFMMSGTILNAFLTLFIGYLFGGLAAILFFIGFQLFVTYMFIKVMERN